MNAASASSDGASGRFARNALRAGWPGTRVLKSAVAAGVARYVTSRFGDAAPVFAVFGALNGMQPTIATSLRRVSGALLGIVLGTALAVVSEQLVDAPRSVMVALLVALGLLVAVRLHAYALLGTEVAVTALLVFALSQGSLTWAVGRFGETALGGGIAILINALVMPPDYRQDARRATRILAHELALHLRTALQDAIQPPSRESALAHLLAARAASRRADELIEQTARVKEALRFSPVLRYSPLRRTTPWEIERYAGGIATLAAGLGHARTACRATWHATRRALRLEAPVGDWEGLLAVIDPTIDRFERYVLEGSSAASDAAAVAVRYALAKHAEVLSASRESTRPWDMDRSTVLAEIEQVLDDLRRTLRDQAPSAA